MTDFPEETVLLVAKSINGPHSAEHIGEEKLRELQDHRWDAQTTKIDKAQCINAARAALSAMTKDANLYQTCFVGVLGEKILTNSVGSNKQEVEANLGLIELTQEEMDAVEIVPTKMMRPQTNSAQAEPSFAP